MLLKSVAVIVLFASCGIQYTTAQSSSSIDAFLRAVHKLDKGLTKTPFVPQEPTNPEDDAGKTAGASTDPLTPPPALTKDDPGKSGNDGKEKDTSMTVEEGRLWKEKVLPKFVSEFALDQGIVNNIEPIRATDDASVIAHIRATITKALTKKYAENNCDISKIVSNIPNVKELVRLEFALCENNKLTVFNWGLLLISLRKYYGADVNFKIPLTELSKAFVKGYEDLCPEDTRYKSDVESVNEAFMRSVLRWQRSGDVCSIPLDVLGCPSLRETVDHVISKDPTIKAKYDLSLEKEKGNP
jgi:hypothetical protein